MTFETLPAQITEFINAHPLWMPAVVAVLAFGESIAFVSLVLPFWGMLVAVGAALGLSNPAFYPIWVAASIGAALGDWVSYWLGYHYHRQISRMWPISKYPKLMPRGRLFFNKYGVWAIVLGRFSGPLRAAVPLVAGAAQMNRTMFQIANWTSAFLWSFVLLVFGGGIGTVLYYVTGLLGGS